MAALRARARAVFADLLLTAALHNSWVNQQYYYCSYHYIHTYAQHIHPHYENVEINLINNLTDYRFIEVVVSAVAHTVTKHNCFPCLQFVYTCV